MPDGRRRFILWIASRYLVNVKGLGLEAALRELEGFLDASCRNYGNCSRVYTSWLRSVLRAVWEKKLYPPSLRRLKERHPDLYAILVSLHATDAGKIGINPSIPEPIASFLAETGLRTFTYQDVKEWLESKKGRVTSEEWSRTTRLMRKFAEDGLLGRMYEVNGEWIDYGPGPTDKPPSRRVKFYIYTSGYPID